jgi:FlaA1/EpsC-like NDP-sugar epimerase
MMLAVVDFLILFFALWMSYKLRLGFGFSPNFAQLALIAVAPVMALPILYRFGFYRVVVRYVTDATLWTIAKGLGLSILLWLGLAYMTELRGIEGVPRSIPVIYFVMAGILLAGSRFFAKWAFGATVERVVNQKRMLIYGAGPVGRQLAAALRVDPLNRPVGFVDDDPVLHGAEVAGLRVHAPDDIAALVEELQVGEIIVCSDAVDQKAKTLLFRELAKTPVRVAFLPTVVSGWGGDLVGRIRDIGIGDLLGRPMVAPDPTLLRAAVAGKTVFVSGAGGSIGSELCRQIVDLEPKTLILLDIDEFALYEIERALQARAEAPIVPVLGSVTDRQRLKRLFDAHPIDTVFHAAAYKHVSLVEQNALVGIENNVLGTWTLAEIAFDHDVECFVLISTDKAVRPANVMGATKRWAELIIHSFAGMRAGRGDRRRFCAVRFGNVIGSQGSVVPLFKEQIARGGPVTLTDAGMTRYFMSVNEAVELIIQAASLSRGGETFLLDMGEPVRIRDLAENLIRLAGLSVRDDDNPTGDIAIELVGTRPGEKVVEELFYDPARVEKTAHPKIMFGRRTDDGKGRVRDAVAKLAEAVGSGDEARARSILFDFTREP